MLLRESAIRQKLDKLDKLNKLISVSVDFTDFVIHHSLPMVLANSEGKIMFCNDSMLKLIGKTQEEVKGKVAGDVYYYDYDQFLSAVQCLVDNEIIEDMPLTIKTVDGPCVMRAYSSVNRDKDNNWINTRCVFVP